MRLVPFIALDHLTPWVGAWNELAGDNTFRSATWLTTWWEVYGRVPGRELCVVGGFDASGRLVGVAPWYRQKSARFGPTLRMLGDGDVCSDYLGLPAAPEHAAEFAAALADWLSVKHTPPSAARRWNLMDLTGVAADDLVTQQLCRTMASQGTSVSVTPGANCWRVHLPTTWAEYERTLSRSHRKQLRRLQARYFATGRAVLKSVTSLAEISAAFTQLIELHERRRGALGMSGSFADPTFREFHERLLPRLFATGQLQLHTVELDGRPIAAEYHFGRDIVYAYQAGIEPEALEHEPGRLATLATLQRAIAGGCRAYDLLRGDEPYKAHFRAMPIPLHNIRIVADHATARWRYRVGSLNETVKRWLQYTVFNTHTSS